MSKTIFHFIKGLFAACLLPGLVSCATTEAIPDSQSRIEVAFGPESGAKALILKAIASSTQSIRLAAFALSSPVIVQALIDSKRRGVDVQVVVDYGHNVAKDSKGIGQNALASLVLGGVAVHTNDEYRKLHDKFTVIDGKHVQTGSYNYAKSANRNSENVLVIWNDPPLAGLYLRHWQSRFNAGLPYSPQ